MLSRVSSAGFSKFVKEHIQHKEESVNKFHPFIPSLPSLLFLPSMSFIISLFFVDISIPFYPLLIRAMLALAQLVRKDSKASQAPRVVPAALASPALATSEPQASVANQENLVFLGCQGSQVYLDREVSVDREEQQRLQKEE